MDREKHKEGKGKRKQKRERDILIKRKPHMNLKSKAA